jgi:hypothetical protein
MSPKQISGREFCGACEVPNVCTNPMVQLSAKLAIRSMLNGHTAEVRDQLLNECLYENDQLTAIFHCARKNSNGACDSLLQDSSSGQSAVIRLPRHDKM